MEIFEPQHQRLLRRQGFQRLGHLPQHPLAGGSLGLALQGIEVSGAEECGHLHEPGRRMLAEELYKALSPWLSTQLPQR